MASALSALIISYIDEDSREIANRYYTRLSELHNQTKNKGDIDISGWYLASKAYMMKNSTRMRDHVEAQMLFKELLNFLDDAPSDVFKLVSLAFCLGNLCDLLIEELSIYKDPEILDEINPLITKMLEMAENVNNYAWLAEGKTLQAKLSLIQMNVDEAKRVLKK